MNAKQKCVKDIRDLIVEQPTTIHPQQNIKDLLKCFLEDQRTRHVYVVDEDKKIIGSVRLNDLVEYIEVYLQCLDDKMFDKFTSLLINKKAADVMSRDFLCLKDDMLLSDMIATMLEHKVDELPVVDDNNRIIGEVNFLEFINFLSENEHLAV